MARMVEVYHRGGDTMFENWGLRETEINPTHVIKMTEDDLMKDYLARGYLPNKLSKNQSFVRVNLATGLNLIVVGTLEQISEKLISTANSKQLLHG